MKLSKLAFEQILRERDVEGFKQHLPQGSFLKDEDIHRWMDHFTSGEDFHDAYWHYKRLSGIGGSESLAAVMHFAAEHGKPMFDPFTSPTDFAAAKLLKTLPSESTGPMRRGNELESHIIDLLVRQTGGKVRYDLMEQVAAMSGNIKDHAWLVGNPDLIIEFPSGRIYLADIKAPDDASDDFPFGYTVQLHHYRELALHAGVSLDGMLLCNFDWKAYKVLPLAVPHQPEVTEAIYQGGDALWEKVCQGEIPYRPRFDSSDMAPVSASIQEKLANLEEEYLSLYTLSNEIAKAQDVVSSKMVSLLEGVEGATERKSDDLGFSFLSVNGRSKINADAVKAALASHDALDRLDSISELDKGYDAVAMAERLIALGEDIDQFRSRKFDTKKTLALLSELGVSRSTAKATGMFKETIIPVYRAPKKSGPKLDAHETLKAVAFDVSSSAISEMQRQVEVVFSDGVDMDAHQINAEFVSVRHIAGAKQTVSNSADQSNVSSSDMKAQGREEPDTKQDSAPAKNGKDATLMDFLRF